MCLCMKIFYLLLTVIFSIFAPLQYTHSIHTHLYWKHRHKWNRCRPLSAFAIFSRSHSEIGNPTKWFSLVFMIAFEIQHNFLKIPERAPQSHKLMHCCCFKNISFLLLLLHTHSWNVASRNGACRCWQLLCLARICLQQQQQCLKPHALGPRFITVRIWWSA